MMQFIDHTYWNPISYLIPVPSFYHPSLYPHPFSFASQPRISFPFLDKKQLLQLYDTSIHL